MNYIEKRVFGYLAPDAQKLLDYGFELSGGTYTLRTRLLDNSMTLNVFVVGDSVSSRVYDDETGDEYTLHTVEGAVGEFVGRVRSEYESALSDIARKCFYKKVFKDEQVYKILEYARKTWGDEPEFLWDDTPDCCVLRRKDTKKWYAVILTAKAEKLGLNAADFLQGDGKAVLLDIRALPEEIDKLVDGVKYFNGYHMNKKHWLTIPLNGVIPSAEIFTRLENSYALAKK